MEMHSWRCLCTENPGDRKERVTEGRGPKLRRAASRSDRPAAGPSHPGTHPGAAGVALTEERPWGCCPVCRELPSGRLGHKAWLKPTSHPWDTTTCLVLPLFLTQPSEHEPNTASSRKVSCHSVPDPHSFTADPSVPLKGQAKEMWSAEPGGQRTCCVFQGSPYPLFHRFHQ